MAFGGARRNLGAAGGDDRVMRTLQRLTLALAAAATICGGVPAFAQDHADAAPEPSAKRLDRFEKELREVRQIVLQAHATGQPVEIKEAGPDPQVVALQAKLDEQDAVLRRLTGEIETLSHDLEAARKDSTESHAQIADLTDRLGKLEKAASPAPDAGAAQRPPPGEAAAASPTAAPGEAKAAYAHAHQLMMDGDYPGAAAAFQAYLDRYGEGPTAGTARYWLGQIKFSQGDYTGAAAAYLGAIRGWPQTSWAPDAVVGAARALLEIKKPVQACGALGEFARRYPAAAHAVKAEAAATRVKANCAG